MSPLSRLFSQHRIKVSRVFGFAFVAALLATGSVWQGTWVGRVMFLAGIVLAAVGMVGRIWCLVYSSGYKSSELVTQGPYSVSRNPLYFFSFVGLIGIGLATETVTLTLFLVAFFALVYPAVIAGEEEFLRGKFGDAYAEYCRTPALRRTGVLYRAAAHPASLARWRDLVHRPAGRDPAPRYVADSRRHRQRCAASVEPVRRSVSR
jgi:protein-S-isoprenylcysteine O-methyltransferase Ste14